MPNANAHGAAATNGGQQPPKPVTIAFVLYPGFTALDIIGPFQVLASVPGHEAVFVAAEPGPVTDDTGRCQLIASASLEQMTAPDVVVIGGTLFNKEPDHEVVQWLRQVRPATSMDNQRLHRGYLPGRCRHPATPRTPPPTGLARRADRCGARYTEQRVVERGKAITAAGVSAGIDGSHPSARMHGPSSRLRAFSRHRRRPPTRRPTPGSPSKASAELVEFVVRWQLEHARRARAEHRSRRDLPRPSGAWPPRRAAAGPAPPAPGLVRAGDPITSLPSVITCTSPGRLSAPAEPPGARPSGDAGWLHAAD